MKDILPPSDSAADALRVVMEIISDGIWDWNVNTGYVYRNPGWYTMLGYEPHSLDNTVLLWESLIHERDYQRVMTQFEQYISNQSSQYKVEYRCRTRQGDYIWIEDCGKIVAWNEDGSVARMIGAHRNINDRKVLLEHLAIQNKSLEAMVKARTNELIKVNAELERKVEENKRLAETDSLTGTANRYRMEKVLKKEVARAERFQQPLSVIALDLDDFKDINDDHGHATGDLVLIHFSKLISSNLREIDVLARWGGDEFMIILPNTDLEAALHTAEKLRQLIMQTPLENRITITTSIGVAELQPGEPAMRLSVRADIALYASKFQGKNLISY